MFGDKTFTDEGNLCHEECIKDRLIALKQSGINSEVIDFILAKFESKAEKKVGRKFGGFFRKA